MIISLDIGTKKIAVTALEKNGAHSHFMIPAPSNYIIDGHIQNLDDLALTIDSALKERNLTAKKAVFVLPSSHAMYKEFTIPKVPEKQILPMLYSQISATIENSSEFVIDYIFLYSEKTGEGEMYTVLGTIIHKDIVTQYLELCRKLNMTCLNVDLRFNALRKYILSNPHPIGDTVYMAVNLTEDEFEINLIDQQRIFVKSIPLKNQILEGVPGMLLNWTVNYAGEPPRYGDTTDSVVNILVTQLTNMIQFQQSKGDYSVDNIYIYGDIGNLEAIVNKASMALERDLLYLSSDKEALAFINTVGAVLGFVKNKAPLYSE